MSHILIPPLYPSLSSPKDCIIPSLKYRAPVPEVPNLTIVLPSRSDWHTMNGAKLAENLSGRSSRWLRGGCVFRTQLYDEEPFKELEVMLFADGWWPELFRVHGGIRRAAVLLKPTPNRKVCQYNCPE